MIILNKDHSALYKGINLLTNFDERQYNPQQKAINQAIDFTTNIARAILPQSFSVIPTAVKYTSRMINNYVNQPTQRNVQFFQFENSRYNESKGNSKDKQVTQSQEMQPRLYVTQDRQVLNKTLVPIQMLENMKLYQQMQKKNIQKKSKALQKKLIDDFKFPEFKQKPLVPYNPESSPIIQVFQSGKPLNKEQYRTFVKRKIEPSQRIQRLLQIAREQRIPSRLQFVRPYNNPNDTKWHSMQPKLI